MYVCTTTSMNPVEQLFVAIKKNLSRPLYWIYMATIKGFFFGWVYKAFYESQVVVLDFVSLILVEGKGDLQCWVGWVLWL